MKNFINRLFLATFFFLVSFFNTGYAEVVKKLKLLETKEFPAKQ